MLVNFNLNDVKSYNSLPSKLPDGDYAVKIVEEEQTATALVFSYQVLEGDYRGAIIKDWINLNHAKETARDIAKRRLKAIGQAVGVATFRDTRELFNRPFVVYVITRSYRANDGTTRETNSIEGYRASASIVETTPEGTGAPEQAAAGPFWN